MKSEALVITRRYDAPRERVWRAWTDPDELEKWWSPKDYTSPECRVDLRVGGAFLYCHRTPDGTNIWGKGVYREIVPFEKLVYLNTFSDKDGNVKTPEDYGMSAGHPHESIVTVRFSDDGIGTRVELSHELPASFPEREMMRAGWNEMLDKLEDREGTVTRATSNGSLEITRVYDAPIERVWRAWTEPEAVARWWGPAGFDTARCELDPKPGGQIRIDMRGPDGTVYPMVGEYVEISEGKRIVFTASPLDEQGRPFVTHNEIELAEEKNGTRLTVRIEVSDVTERADQYLHGARQGWLEQLERLAEEVAR